MWRRFGFVLLLLIACAACSTDPPFVPTPLTYEDRAPIPLDVAEVTIENRSRAPGTRPQIEQTLPVAPLDATRDLLRQRLRAGGDSGTALVVIDDARVIEETVGPFGGADAGNAEPGSQTRLHGRIKVRAIEYDASGNRTGSITTAVARTVGLPPDASSSRRRAAGYQLVRNLVDDLDRGLVENAYANLAIAGR